jgi:hypothetical protein
MQRDRYCSFPLDHVDAVRLEYMYGTCTNVIRDSVGRNHAYVSALGPAQLYIWRRSVKYNPVSIVTHVSDWERIW